jgi:hypothetical protein
MFYTDHQTIIAMLKQHTLSSQLFSALKALSTLDDEIRNLSGAKNIVAHCLSICLDYEVHEYALEISFHGEAVLTIVEQATINSVMQ